jgi:hypothetical protein
VPVKNPRATGGCVCTETPALFVCMRDRASHTQRTMSQDYTGARTIQTRGHLCFRLRSVLAGYSKSTYHPDARGRRSAHELPVAGRDRADLDAQHGVAHVQLLRRVP